MPKVSVIVLSYNSKQNVLDCIRSITTSDFKDYELLLVDNASSDDTVQEVSRIFPTVRIVKSGVNLGRTGGYNLGIRHACGSLILFLDQDTEISPRMLSELVTIMNSDEGIGGCGPKIYYFNDPSRLWSAGSYVAMLTGRTHFIGRDKFDCGQFDRVIDVQQHPTALMVRSQLANAIGGYDSAIFMVYCDADFCLKIWEAGRRIVLAPRAKLWHKVKKSSHLNEKLGMKTPLMAFLIGRNRIIFMKKHVSMPNFSLFLTLFLPIYLIYYSVVCMSELKIRMLQAFWRGTMNGLKFVLFNKKTIIDVFNFF
jgi:GT2 family glycosyltransferase